MQTPGKTSIRCYAKINLGLHIIRKRTDGYHDIETVFHRVNLYDVVTVEKNNSRDIKIHCTNPEIPTNKSNICYKAANKFFSTVEYNQDLTISIEKNIPVGAGLGGGSSNAAAVLQACNKLYDYPIGEEILVNIASEIGSDVPYFMQSGSAYATGRGENLEYFNLELPYWIVLVYPHIHIDTAWAYQSCTPNQGLKSVDLRALVRDNMLQPRTWTNALRNDFEPVVFRAHPVIMRIKETLIRGGADFALMSGSGSSVFGLYQDEMYAREIAESLSQTYDVWLTPPFFNPETQPTEQKADV